MTSRIEAMLHREKAEMLEACADQQEKLAQAKQDFEADPTPENAEARRSAMTEMYEFRKWVRSVARLNKLRDELTRMPATQPERPALEAELNHLEKNYAAFANGLQALRGTSAGSVEVEPKTIRAKGRPKRLGGS